MGDTKNKAYILPHTHWDREWRYPIWKSRALLVRFMDSLLHILDRDPEYRCFLLDGQVAPVLDYLEVMPQNRDKVSGYIKEGRIAVGPWFTLPDLYPVDGECLVRNLLRGTREAEALGGRLNVGYNSFGWGQTAQFPQLYAGFGIDFIICAKKVSEQRAPQSEFLWQSPDGTTILTSRLGEHARANFYFNAYLPAKYGVNCMSAEFRYSRALSGGAIHNAAPENRDDDFFVIRPNLSYDRAKLAESFPDAWKAADATAVSEHRLFLNGTDFSTPQPQLSDMLRDLNELCGDTEFLHCRLEEYAEALKKNIDTASLKTVTGELRDGPACDCSGNALSSRAYLKLLNKKAQTSLLSWAEPLSAAMWTNGEEYPAGMLKKAWDYMFKSHPHDSINGVTQDKTANDVEYRLNQALEIGRALTDEAASNLAARLDLSRYNDDAILLLVYNPHPYAVFEIGEVIIATPESANIWDFTARDSDGNQLAVQEAARDEKAYPAHDMEARPWPFLTHRHLCHIEFGAIPAMGYKIIEIIPQKRFGPGHFYWLPMRRAVGENILAGSHTLQNEHLRAEVTQNGTIRMTHRATGRVYENLHYFEDAGDVGNYWAYYPPYHNEIHTTLGGNVRVWDEECGPLSATVAVEYTLQIPKDAQESIYGVRGAGRRGGETVELKIVSRFTLKKGARRLDVRTTLNNNARFHRLRVAFPTGIMAGFADAEGHFTVDRRPHLNQPGEDGGYWPEMQTLPLQSFVDISDGKDGFAVVGDSLTEYEYANDEHATLYLTLFRAMGNMIVTWWEAVGRFEDQDGSQLQRQMEFTYGIYPHEGGWQVGAVYREARRFAANPGCWQLTGGGAGDLPPKAEFLEISDPDVILSAFKKAEDRDNLILRLFNPADSARQTEISFGFPLSRAWLCSLNEERQNELRVTENALSVTLAAGKIITVELEKR